MKLDTDKVKETLGKVKEAAGKVSKKVWIIVAAVLVLIVAAIIIYWNTRPYAVLITGAAPDEVSYVVNWLEQRNVTDYRYQGTDTILVPERKAAALKGSLLTETYKSSNSAFTGYFDNISMLSTERARSDAWWIAVTEKFESVVGSMDGVQSAEIVITPGEDRSYVLDSGNVVNASASVKVTMRAGRSMTSQLASAIRAYLSGGVQGLKMDSVEVIDNYGNQFNAGGQIGNLSSGSAAKLQAEEEYSNYIRTELMKVLTPFFGDDGVRVGVYISIEWSDRTETIHDVRIPDYVDSRISGKGIYGSQVWNYQYIANGETIPGGLVGTGVNSDIVTDVEKLPGLEDTNGKLVGGGQIDYDNSYTDATVIYTAGRVTDCTISVSVNATRAGDMNIEDLRHHVAMAAGITAVATENMTAEEYLASKISVFSWPFYEEPIPPGTVEWWESLLETVPWWVFAAIGGGLLLIIILLIVILSIRRKRREKRLAEEQAQQEEQESMEELLAAVGLPQLEPVGADVMSLQTEKSMELRQDIRRFAEENPEVAAQLLRTWLRGGDANG